MIFISFQSYINSGDYDDEEEYPDLNDRLEAYKSKNPAGLNLKSDFLSKIIGMLHTKTIWHFFNSLI